MLFFRRALALSLFAVPLTLLAGPAAALSLSELSNQDAAGGVKSMTISDAKNILTGGDTSVTDFFRARTSSQLAVQFLPIVKKVTDRSNLASKYNTTMAMAPRMGLVSKEQATVEGYVTQRALDGLYTMIAEEEKAIRADPIGTGSKLLGKVFGALKQ